MIWNPEYECMSREELKELQSRRLQTTVAWAYDRVPYYRTTMDRIGVRPRDVKVPGDVRRLPFTDKETLLSAYPFGLFALELEDVVRLHSSSGTTAKPVVVGYSRGDLNTWSELTARVGALAGVTRGDLVDIAWDYNMVTGGWGMHAGLERIGATIIPGGSGQTERHLAMLRDFGATALVSTPSYALVMAERGEAMGLDMSTLPLRVALLGGEPLSASMQREIESRLHVRVTDNYGLSEVMGPGVAGSCECDCGMHLAEDHFIFEVVDPQTGESVEEGSEGELIITPISREAMPILRYRTHDLTSITAAPCACGRTSARMSPVRKRTDDMIIIAGVNVFPSQVEDVLATIEGATPHYLIVVDPERMHEDVEVRVEVEGSVFSDMMADMVAFQRTATERMSSVLGLQAKITLVEPGTIERSVGKAHRVLDLRRDA